MQSVLIDTDIVIDYLRGIGSADKLLYPLWDNGAAFLNILTVYELYSGMKNDEKEATEDFMNACNIEPVTMESARKGGEFYRHYRAKGITLTTADCLISATAIINNHRIATKNIKHYPEKRLLYHI